MSTSYFDSTVKNRGTLLASRAYGGKSSMSRSFRARRFRKFTPIIDAIIAEKGHCRIADIGGEKSYWGIAGDFVETRPVEIHLINLHPHDIDEGKFVSAVGDATSLSQYDDMSFDFVHSNSVIEHVGDWSAMRAMAAEVQRIAPAYYIQTPNFWFPYEPHYRCAFFHWLPEQIRYAMLMRFALGFSERQADFDGAVERVNDARLLDRTQMRALFPEAEHSSEWFMGLPKSLIAIRR